MAKVIMMCGRICSGKSTFAKKLAAKEKAVIFSADGIMLALFGSDAGEMHDIYLQRTKKYIFEKAAETAGNGIDAIIDLGLFTKAERDFARDFFGSRNIAYEIIFIDISDEEWRKRIEKRNRSQSPDSYFVDEGLLRKCVFEFPEKDETDITYCKG